jgi:hypothetical protein
MGGEGTGRLRGMPTEGNPAPVLGPTTPGYVEGPTPNTSPTVPAGNTNYNAIVPTQRDVRGQNEGRWTG